jgi:hypothetical protein
MSLGVDLIYWLLPVPPTYTCIGYQLRPRTEYVIPVVQRYQRP